LSAERAKSPRDPKTFTATALNPDFQAMIAARLKAIAPEGSYAPEKVGDYLAAYRKLVVTDPKVTFTVTAAFDGKVIRLAGESSERKYHDQFIDVLVAMKLYAIVNDVKIPR
jgi:hypothetical protein